MLAVLHAHTHRLTRTSAHREIYAEETRTDTEAHTYLHTESTQAGEEVLFVAGKLKVGRPARGSFHRTLRNPIRSAQSKIFTTSIHNTYKITDSFFCH